MRVTPRPLIAVALAVVYLAIVGVLWVVQGVDYSRIGETTASLVTGIVVPVGVGALFLAVATTYLGWWRPALVEPRRAPRWLWVVPVLFVLPGVGYLGVGNEQTGTWLLVLGVGTLLIGFSEELLTRGTGLVGLRGRFAEPLSWFFSCLIFGLLHGLNVLFGQGALDTIAQVASAFAAGSVLYLLRRLAGSLVPCMLVHAFFDFTSFTLPADAATSGSPWLVLGVALYPAYVLALIGVLVVLRRDARDPVATDTRSRETPPAAPVG
jgi:membrane protease YdiL (CAAX protease family)